MVTLAIWTVTAVSVFKGDEEDTYHYDVAASSLTKAVILAEKLLIPFVATYEGKDVAQIVSITNTGRQIVCHTEC